MCMGGLGRVVPGWCLGEGVDECMGGLVSAVHTLVGRKCMAVCWCVDGCVQCRGCLEVWVDEWMGGREA